MNNGDLWLMALKRPFVRKKPSQEEYRLQVSIVKYLSLKQNQRKDFIFFAVPNGEKRDQVTAAKLKAAGVLSGVSDLILVFKNKVVFVELKTLKGKQSPNQVLFEGQVKKLGYDYIIWRSLDDCVKFFGEKGKC